MTETILLVDDDQRVLEAMRRNLRSRYTVKTAVGSVTGLRTLETDGPFAVVVADLKMPVMDGSRFLAKVRERSQDTVQIMLTGQADLDSAIRTVNKGKLFRFLTKPCPVEDLTQALDAALEQYRLVRSERELLEETLSGSVQLLTEMLELVNPVAFGRTSRIRTLVGLLIPGLGTGHAWQLELTALLSQVGLVAVPGEILEKVDRGEALTDREQTVWSQHPQVGRDLVVKIPRLEAVAESIAWQLKRFDGKGPPEGNVAGKEIPLGARVLKAVVDYDALTQQGADACEALARMGSEEGCYDPHILELMKSTVVKVKAGYEFRTVSLDDLYAGMITTGGIYTKKRQLIVGKGTELTPTLLARIRNFARWQKIDEPLGVLAATRFGGGGEE